MSDYYERQARPQLGPIASPARDHTNGIIVGFVGVAAFAFCLGMVVAAAMVGVL